MNTSLLESEVKSLFESYNDLFSTLVSMDTSSLDTPMSPGKWSAGQTAAHVILASELSVQYCLKGLQKGKNRQRAGILTGIRGVLLVKALRSDRKYKAPEQAAKVPDRADLTSLTARYEELVKELDKLREFWHKDYLNKSIYKHPVAGPLNFRDFYRFQYEHVRHHHRQILAFLDKPSQH